MGISTSKHFMKIKKSLSVSQFILACACVVAMSRANVPAWVVVTAWVAVGGPIAYAQDLLQEVTRVWGE